MLLRANSQLNDEEADLAAITQGSSAPDAVPHGQLLAQWVEQTLGAAAPQAPSASELRAELAEALGVEGLVDAAAILGNFQRMVRIADGTGIPLDRPVSVISANLRKDLGIDQFGSAERTPKVSPLLGGSAKKWHLCC